MNRKRDAVERRKRARQAARSVLVNAAETGIVVTANFRAWRHLLEMRGALGPDREFRRLAVDILRLLQAHAPSVFGDYELQEAEDGTGPFIVSRHRKV